MADDKRKRVRRDYTRRDATPALCASCNEKAHMNRATTVLDGVPLCDQCAEREQYKGRHGGGSNLKADE